MAKRRSRKPFRRHSRPKFDRIAVRLNQIDYKNVALLQRFLTERKKILGKRITGNSAKIQRKLSREIKKARLMALLPFTEKHEI